MKIALSNSGFFYLPPELLDEIGIEYIMGYSDFYDREVAIAVKSYNTLYCRSHPKVIHFIDNLIRKIYNYSDWLPWYDIHIIEVKENSSFGIINNGHGEMILYEKDIHWIK